MQGKVEEGIVPLRRAAKFWEPIGFRMTRALELEAEAQVCINEGRTGDAWALLKDAVQETDEFLWLKSSMLRAQVNFLIQIGAGAGQIEAIYREDVEFSRAHAARFDELQSTTQFAGWLKLQDRTDEARTMLAGDL